MPEVQHDSPWDTIRPLIANKEEFKAVESEEERLAVFDKVIRRLKEKREETGMKLRTSFLAVIVLGLAPAATHGRRSHEPGRDGDPATPVAEGGGPPAGAGHNMTAQTPGPSSKDRT